MSPDTENNEKKTVAVIIPAYKVRNAIGDVLGAIGPEVDRIYVVDDCCPQETGKFVRQTIGDKRVLVLFHERNQGVGGATLTGMKAAVADGADCLIKIDGDGQHDPSFIGEMAAPILAGEADYTKGNRFYRLEDLSGMPPVRIVGNAILSCLAKLSTGYWNVFDPTNGYIAIHSVVFHQLPEDKISRDYFFESDMLFRLYTVRGKIVEIPMHAVYGNEESSLKPRKTMLPFLWKHLANTGKRVAYSYFLRNFSMASLLLLFGLSLFLGGTVWDSSRGSTT